MRASDQTFYDKRLLHLWMAAASLALLAATLWMVAADHRREWKQHQRTFRDRIEPWATEAQIVQERSREFLAREEELSAALAEARAMVPPSELIERFGKELESEAASLESGPPDLDELRRAYDALAAEPSIAARDALMEQLGEFTAAATLRRQNAQRRLRFRRAEFDEARTYYETAGGEGASQAALEKTQAKVERAADDVTRLTAELQTAAAHCDALDAVVREITEEEDAARNALADHRATLDRLDRNLAAQQTSLGKRMLRLPLIDAFGRPLAIDQTWLPELTIDYNFRQVARFDRCATCHEGIDHNAPGRADQPAFNMPRELTVRLATPRQAPDPPSLEDVYGLVLAERGILDPDVATIVRIAPKSLAADAKLCVGDAIAGVDLAARPSSQQPARPPSMSRLEVEKALLEEIEWGTPATLHIRRGLPQPFCSHPRLDLFVGSLSPHPKSEFGCTICHDGQGSATEFKWASHTPNDRAQRNRWRADRDWFRNPHWDFPMMAARFVESRCLRCHHRVTDLEPSRRFPDPPAPKLLAGYQLVRTLGCFGCHEINGIDPSGRSIGPDMRLEPSAPEAGGVPHPGTMRKVGPTLRDTADRLEAPFLHDLIGNPTRVLPTARMPRFYGLHEHLDGGSLDDARRFEAVEIRAVAEYLLAAGQPVEPVPEPAGVTETPLVERGKRVFQIQGCLACHRHTDFPKGQGTQGPDLSNLATKYTGESARRWLVGWVRDPSHYSPRTLMPNSLLAPVLLAGDARSVTDPAADVAAYLLASPSDYRPRATPALVERDLDELALMHLGKQFPLKQAAEYLRNGIPQSMTDRASGDAAMLLGEMSVEKKLRYVGSRTIRKRGCYGCHDVPGFEQAQPIGPELSAWGRKQESLLAFEQIDQYLDKTAAEKAADGDPDGDPDDDPDRDFFTAALRGHRREGFIWHKLRRPRSFDYVKVHNKPYNQRLTMGRFDLNQQQIEAIATFVLGLLAEPPAEKYVYQGDVRRRAIAEGRKLLDKYACAACHVLEMERWQFEFDPDEFFGPPATEEYDFVKPLVTPRQTAASLQTDLRGLGHAEVTGMPRGDATGRLLEDEDDDGNPLFFFTLWEPAVINGSVWTVGGAEVMISGPRVTGKRPPLGGALARLLYPDVLAEARASGSSTSEVEALGWVPPSLVNEGARVRPQWLHDYLLQPTAIRPAAVLRMPRYNMSPDEAGKLVDYFAAMAGAEFPYSSHRRGRSANLAAAEALRPGRLDDAMRVLIDRQTYCAKCHLIGEFGPGGENRTILAPDLERVGRRIRPDYVRRWLASPKSVLPYTAMPVNFPPTGDPLGQDLFPGSSMEQLDAVVDLLLNYDWYVRSRTKTENLVPPVVVEDESTEGGTDE